MSKWALAVLGFGACLLAHAQDSAVSESPKNSFQPDRIWKVSIGADPRQPPEVTPFVWRSESSRVVSRVFGTSVDSVAQIEGEFKKPDPTNWKILWQDREFDVSSKGLFRLELPYDSDLTSLELMAVSATGEVEYHFYQLKVAATPQKTPGATVDSKNKDAPVFKRAIDKRFYISPGLGLTFINYNEPGFDPYTATVLTAKVSANYLLVPPKWDLGMTAFGTAVTLSNSGSAEARFLGVNLRLGYIFPQIKAPWRLAIYGGWYYSTMLAAITDSEESFGYSNVSGPQLFPTLRRTFSNGHSLNAYFKFSPISSSLGLMSISNNEIAGGLSYTIPTERRNYSINFDYARLTLAIDENQLSSSNLTFGGSMSF